MSSLLLSILLSLFTCCICSGPAAGGGEGKTESYSGSSVDTDSAKYFRNGFPIMMNCPFVSTEESVFTIKWFKDNSTTQMDSESTHYTIFPNSTLYIRSANKEDIGVYRCETEGLTEVKAFTINVISMDYKKLPKSMTVLQGESLTLSCEAEGKPTPVITWSKDDLEIHEGVNMTRFTLDKNSKNIDNASFKIEEAIYTDRGDYTCFITSHGITFNTTTFVRVKDMYAALWPFLGICAEVIVLCIIIFVYEKRRMKVEFEESDNDQPENKTTTENKDVRQRK